MKTYSKADRTITASTGDSFVIELDGNPTTGYQWRLQFDKRVLQLVEQNYEPGGTNVGGGGKEKFFLKVTAAGNTEIRAEYKRPWEQTAIEEHVFTLRAK